MKRLVWLSISSETNLFIVLCLVSFTFLISLASPKFLFASTTTRFLYDGDGVRVAKIEEGKTTVYVGDTEKNLQTGETIKYYGLGGKRIAVKDNSGTNYIVSNHLGSLTALIDSSGNPKSDIHYYPYGTVRAKTGIAIASRQYTSQVNDESTGLYFYNARYYNPQTANFVSADSNFPILNRYGYVNRNPINLVDPSGRESEPPPTDVDVLKAYAKSTYGVNFIGNDIDWSISEMRSAMRVFDVFPSSVVQGKNFIRRNGGDRGGEVFDDSPNDIYIYPDPGKIHPLGRIDSPDMDESKINYTIEHLVAHELMHTIHIQSSKNLIAGFESAMGDLGFGWAVLDWRPTFYGTETRNFERMTDQYLAKAASIKTKFYSQETYYVPGIGNTVTAGGRRPFPTHYSLNIPGETFAEYGMLYYLDIIGGLLGWQDFEKFPFDFFNALDSDLRGSYSSESPTEY